MTRALTILGATGSIGPLDRRGRPAPAATTSGSRRSSAAATRRRLPTSPGGSARALRRSPTSAGQGTLEGGSARQRASRAGPGEAAVLEAAERDADIVVAAISGTAGLRPTHAALKRGRRDRARQQGEPRLRRRGLHGGRAAASGAEIMPVDSEHNALDQALAAGRTRGRRHGDRSPPPAGRSGPGRGSGSPRRRPPQAAAHPVWSMGSKINIDSATLMNKGLELIEAHHLFGLDAGTARRARPSRRRSSTASSSGRDGARHRRPGACPT